MAAGVLDRSAYYLSFAFDFLRGRPRPFMAGLSVTDVCNLDCIHCWRRNTGAGHASFDAVRKSLKTMFDMGARYLYVQGGEPCTWSDGSRTIADVVTCARKMGYFHVALCTNGTFPLDASPDSYSVSLDGAPSSHNRIRSGSFDTVLSNIRNSTHPKIFANVTLNRINAPDLEYMARLPLDVPSLRGILVNFHIPYPGVEDLSLSLPERARLVSEALRLKRRGFPILNSFGGLRALGRNDWKRPLPFSVVSDCRDIYHCCRGRNTPGICTYCGYAVWAEIALILDFNFPAMAEAFLRLHSR
ncbi:MAG: radical SAM protein [Planctomycetes bacterium]|nr:radical SAM protein [Planctomycetota bacterium]